jgi:hypothetical protein
MSDNIPKSDPSERINAKVVAHLKSNTVGLGLISASDSEHKMSILLSPDDSLLLAERLIASAMKLDQPPKDKSMKTFLARLLTAMQNK